MCPQARRPSGDGMGIATTGKGYSTMGEVKSKPILPPSTGLWKPDSPAAKAANAVAADAMAGLKGSPVPIVRGVRREATAIGYTPGDDGHAGTKCPDCGGQVDPHAGHIDDGRVSACGKGKPPMREAGYRCRHCGPTIISPEKCGPEGVGND